MSELAQNPDRSRTERTQYRGRGKGDGRGGREGQIHGDWKEK